MSNKGQSRYRRTTELGRGGMGIVYEAYDQELGRAVALKVLHPMLAAQPGLIARFTAEARIAAGLDHPNIVPIYDIGSTGGVPFMAMKLVRGTTLQGLLARGPLPADEAAAILRQVAAALDFAHAAGVVHRDVKPANVLIAEDGQAKVSDFGIARALGASHHTTVDALVGTPEYVAPECVRGDEPTPRSDIYSLGIIAYEMCAGRQPFRGTPLAVLHAQVYDAPPLLDLASPVRPVLGRALAKDPGARFPSAGEFAIAIDAALRAAAEARALSAAAVTLRNLPLQFATAVPGGGRLGRPLTRLAISFVTFVAALAIVLAIGRSGANASTLSGTGSALGEGITGLLPFLAPPTTTATATPTTAPSATPTDRPTSTATPTATATSTPTPTATPSPTPAPTATPPRMAMTQQRLTLAPGETGQVAIQLWQGDRANGSFLVAGGTILGIGSDVVFRVYGPAGSILNVGRVEQEHRFQFTAEATGDYRLTFQNPSGFIGRQVYLTVSHPDRR